MKNALKHIEDIRARMIAAGGCIVFLDFDGTLAPIVSDPSKGRMDPSLRNVLVAIASRAPVAIVTGRAIKDVRRRVAVPGISFAGNHGLEYLIDGRRTNVQISQAAWRALTLVKKRLRAIERTHTGVMLEDKNQSLTLHYRKASPLAVRLIREEVDEAMESTSGAHRLRLMEGLCAFNIVPSLRYNKGTAVTTLYRRLSKGKRPLPIFVGDDPTDEEAFRALSEGITIKVGVSNTSTAHYYVKSQKNAEAFLRLLARTPHLV